MWSVNHIISSILVLCLYCEEHEIKSPHRIMTLTIQYNEYQHNFCNFTVPTVSFEKEQVFKVMQHEHMKYWW